jgi:ATP-binding cassette subfamily B (MDR/TAP) protein 1
MYTNYALGFWWQGSRFIVSNDIGVSSIISVMMSMLLGAVSLGQATPNIRSIANGIMAAGKIFATIDRQSCIDSSSPDGASLDTIAGEIDFKNIRFSYPTRPEVSILHQCSGRRNYCVGRLKWIRKEYSRWAASEILSSY